MKRKSRFGKKREKGLTDFFFPQYCAALNDCIEKRYRSKGYQIVFLLLDGEQLEPKIFKSPKDRIIYAGMDAKTHRTPRADKTYPYPDENYILDQILPTQHLRVSGFHIWDCVQRISRQAFNRGVDVLVDEDLTELFTLILKKSPNFHRENYPSYVQSFSEDALDWELFMHGRAGKPWMLHWNPDGAWYIPSYSRIPIASKSNKSCR